MKCARPITDAALDEVREWQGRALDRKYPIVIFDALRVKIRDADSRTVKSTAVHVALGVTRDGQRDVLGLWIAENEGAKFWLSVMNAPKNRGLQNSAELLQGSAVRSKPVDDDGLGPAVPTH